jgi:hypothetical protein
VLDLLKRNCTAVRFYLKKIADLAGLTSYARMFPPVVSRAIDPPEFITNRSPSYVVAVIPSECFCRNIAANNLTVSDLIAVDRRIHFASLQGST